MFASETVTTTEWVAIGSAAVAFISGIATAYVLITQSKAKIKADARAEEVKQYLVLITEYRKQLVRQGKLIKELQDSVENLTNAHIECREEASDNYGWMRSFRDGWINELRRLGGNTSSVPDLPQRRIHPNTLDSGASEFIKRTTSHDTNMVTNLNDPDIQQNINKSQNVNTPLPPTKPQ